MGRGGKHEFKKVTSPNLRKERKVMVRIPRRSMPTIKKLLNKYEVKGIQNLFDTLVVGGIVFRRKEIIEFIRQHKQKYKDLSVQANLAKLGKAEKVPAPEMYGVNVLMYNADHKAFKDYVIEENIKQQWIWQILFEDGFANEELCIIDLIERAKTLNISSRKKAVARLSNDEYITALTISEANRMLDELTEEYDQRSFDDSIEAAIESRLKTKEEELAKKKELQEDDELEDKISSLRLSRSAQINKLSKPNLEID